MERAVIEIVTQEVIPVVRAALRETTELRAAMQVLAERMDALTAELAEGELAELRRLAGSALRMLDTTHVGGRP